MLNRHETMANPPSPIDRSLGERLRDRRNAIGWSAKQLAEKMQIEPEDITQFEDGVKRIPADRLLALSSILGVRPAYFFGFEDHQPSAPGETPHPAELAEQGLRLNRAFTGVKNSALREAIVSLVIEIAKNDDPA